MIPRICWLEGPNDLVIGSTDQRDWGECGSGNTAHVFDFAPKLMACCHVHVYGITRRGSVISKPERRYSTPDFAQDDWRVIQALKLQKPIIIGHSVAGSN